MTFTTRRKEPQSKTSTVDPRSPIFSAFPNPSSHAYAGGASSAPFPSTPVLYTVEDSSARDAGNKRIYGSSERARQHGAENGPGAGVASGSGATGLSKLLSFGRRGGDKASKAVESKKDTRPPSPMAITQSLPMGFPLPPPSRPPVPVTVTPAVRPLESLPWAHATAFIAPHVVVPPSESMSTFATSSSFASTTMFTDDSEPDSEATSLSLTSSPDSSSQNGNPRMWKVKRVPESPLRSEVTSYSGVSQHSVEGIADFMMARSRNSTPIPGIVAAMLADPETPPRPKRFSTSSTKPSPTSPPFNPVYEKAARALRDSPETSHDADDEVSPPRVREDMLFPSDKVYSSKTRIPSIRFEGISMDAVFAEVEKKMMSEGRSPATSDAEKKARRRTRVLSAYRPGQMLPSVSPSSSAASSLASSASSVSVASSASSEKENERSITPRPLARPLPRRVSSRPSPLNIAAANSVPVWTASASGSGSARSINSIITVTGPRDTSAPSSPVLPVTGPPSPRLATSPVALSPPSPTLQSTLGEAFVPSPALSTTPTFRPVELPEVWVRPPTPTADDGDWIPPVASQVGVDGPAPSASATKVVIREEKRRVVISTRPPRRLERKTTYDVPPVQPPSPILSPPLSPVEPGRLGFLGHASTSDGNKRASLGSQTSSGDEDASDVEEALNKMLLRLNKPHTPPSSPLSEPASGLCPNSPYGYDSDASAYGGTNWDSDGSARTSATINTAAYESDDSATRFGDAPPMLEAVLPLRVVGVPSQGPSIVQLAVAPMEAHRNDGGDGNGGMSASDTDSAFETVDMTSDEDVEDDVEDDIEDDVEDDIEESSDTRTPFALNFPRPSSPRRKVLNTLPPSFDSINSLSSLASSTDSEAEMEVAIVMTGERVTCDYSVGMAL